MSDFGPVSETQRPAQPDRATFYGARYHKVSGRNQVAIPKELKRAIDESQEGTLLLMRWQAEPFLRLYTKKQFDKKMDEMKENLPGESRARVIEHLARNAEPIEPDSQGRFVLPAKWADELNLREEVAFTGAFTFVKIWPAMVQREQERQEAEKLAQVSEQVTMILDM